MESILESHLTKGHTTRLDRFRTVDPMGFCLQSARIHAIHGAENIDVQQDGD